MPAQSRLASRLLAAALDAAGRGWPVFPLWPGSKRPAIRGWPSQATCHGDALTRWWAAAPYNIGIACGPAGLLVVDLDDPAAAPAEPLPPTYTVATPHGEHRYYTVHPDRPGRCTTGVLGSKIDTRAIGGYVVAAGSVRHTAEQQRRYRTVGPVAVVSAPAWLLTALAPAPDGRPAGVAATSIAHPDSYAEAALAGEADRVSHARPGARNSTLFSSAVRLGRLVADGVLHDREAAARLRNASSAHVGIDGFTAAEADRAIANGLRYGQRDRRSSPSRGHPSGHRDS